MNPVRLYRKFREFQRIERLNEEKEILEALDRQELHILHFPCSNGILAGCKARDRLIKKGHIQRLRGLTFGQTAEGHLALLDHRARCGESVWKSS